MTLVELLVAAMDVGMGLWVCLTRGLAFIP